ncbi:MAG: hypothetical protein K1Y02_13505 [Candidatus Hydrogenedentes bacterium]|nr:hypothetical protein [Candidatus Hydrogenedentota bacterium]
MPETRFSKWQGFHGRNLAALAVILSCSMLLPQCESGGLGARDFIKVSQNGFDASDNAEDINSYAWAMRYFRAEGAENGYVYVGTGNNIAGLIGFYFGTLIAGGEITDAPVRPPEIRRHRPDLGPEVWERVFDYRDVENEGEYLTTGFRFMGIYHAAVDPAKNDVRADYLYVATQGLESRLWRSRTGDPGSWESVFTTGEGGASIRYFAEHNGKMYLAYAYDTYEDEPPPGEIWVSSDGVNFSPLMQNGFGNPNNRGIEFLISYNDWLYAGTKNDKEGYEIWKLEGPDKNGAIKVVDHGATDTRNEIAGTPCIFKGQLYVGSIIFFGFNPAQASGFKGCDIIRINEQDEWETVVGPQSLSGYESGFNFFTNSYCWWMEEHDGWLYAGTWDQGTVLSWLLDNLPALISYIQTGEQSGDVPDLPLDYDQWYWLTDAGADIFKTQDGVNWFPVTINGMGDRTNYGWRTMESTPDGYLYLGSANPVDGLEIWRSLEPAATQ